MNRRMDGGYPLPDEEDPRFTFGLILDVAEVLKRHGYDPLHGTDLVDLQQALYGFLYAPSSVRNVSVAPVSGTSRLTRPPRVVRAVFTTTAPSGPEED